MSRYTVHQHGNKCCANSPVNVTLSEITMQYQVHLTLKSSNAKTGPIPVSTTSATTCPSVCPFKAHGCYADGGPLAIHWKAVTNGQRGTDWATFCNTIKALPEGALWRHNQAGDLPGDGQTIDFPAMVALVAANKGRRGFTYTHYSMDNVDNLQAVAYANTLGFTVNLSANDLDHADALADTGVGPVVVVLPMDATSNTFTPKGRVVVVCPATQRDDVSCATCQLCQRQRTTIVGFPAHGASKKKAHVISIQRVSA